MKPPTLGQNIPKAPLHPVVTVGALIENRRGEILLVRTHKWGDRYAIPGGKVEKGERNLAALRRELAEETGLRIYAPRLLLVQDVVCPKEFYIPDMHFVSINYHAKTRDTAFQLNDEAQAGVWIKPQQALGLALNTPTRTLIKALLTGP